MFEAVLGGLVSVVAWPAVGWLVLGVFIGLYFGAVPGLSGLVGMAILLPFTFGMEPVSAFAFLLGMFAVTTTSDTIASVLLGIPGTAATQATFLDGYPMAMRGEAARAFGAAFTVSAVGGLLGAVVLGLSIPIVKPLILSFAQPEFFLLGLLGLTMVGSLAGGSMVKGLIAALFGLTLSYVGYSVTGGTPRYWMGMTYLLDGIPLIPIVLGLFALPEVLELAVRDSSISQVPRDQAKSRMTDGIRDAARNWWLVLRCTVIGAYVGMLPGLGGSIVDWVAYGHVVQSSRDKSQFGKGDVRGVIAPETANNAMKGGALIPTVAFGIPGSASMAILLGALLIQGLQPGPQMLTSNLNITFSMMWTLVIANVAGAILLMIWGNQIAKVTFIRGHLIVPVVCMFVFMGAWLAGNNPGDLASLLIFGLIGYLMKQGGIPRPPLVLGFILGPIMEDALHITMSGYEWADLVKRPISMIILLGVILTLLFAVRANVKQRKAGEKKQLAESETWDPRVSIFMLILIGSVFVYALVPAISWPDDTGRIPLVTAIPGIILCVVTICIGLYVPAGKGAKSLDMASFGRAVYFFVWLCGIGIVTIIAGQLVALPLFMGFYICLWGGYKWWLGALYAAFGLVFLYIMFEEIVAVMWYPSLVFG
ncbi:MAG: tripartite tricarboxylate transporter permease [Pseudomonadota bacterium]|nr:tripartite tricarboxylate transporter permease [Pseudomonadota bacterium]